MSPDTTETAKLILSEVAKAKVFSETGNLNGIFLSAETILSGLAFLLSAKIEAEQKYRIKRQGYINDGMTAAAAEAHAKASDDYAYWQKIEGVYDLGIQQTQLLKRFAPLLKDEYRRS